MKIRSKIYLISGCILIGLSIILDIIDWNNLVKEVKGDGGIGYLIGYHIFLIIGVLLINRSITITKKIKLQNTIADIDGIGKT